MSQITDKHFRKIDYLRISITDHCNLKCLYCSPFSERLKLPSNEILSYEEIFNIVKASVSLGFKKVRITGGEPLIRKDLVHFCRMLSELPQITDLSLSTNGVLLADMAADLKAAGVNRVNISLDTLQPSRYIQISGKDYLKQVLLGIEKAAEVGLTPIKINMVPMKGINEDEIPDMARWTLKAPYDLRFIELMPTNGWTQTQHSKLFIPVETVKQVVEAIGPLTPISTIKTRGPATYASLPSAKGRIGFIAALSHHFCKTCNRLRLTADGQLRPCLFDENEIDIKQVLRQGATLDELKAIISYAVAAKPKAHCLKGPAVKSINGRLMGAIGG